MEFNTVKKTKELQEKGYLRKDPDKKKRRRWFKCKEKQPEPNKKLKDLMPQQGIVGSDNLIKLKFENEIMFMDILQLEGYNLSSMSAAERNEVIRQYEMLIKLYVYPFKIVTMYMPLDTRLQQNYYKRQAELASNPTYKRLLMEQYYEFKYYEENNFNKEFYIFLYGDTVEDLRECRNDFFAYSGLLKLSTISYEKKKSIFFRLNNPLIRQNMNQP